MAEKSKPQLHIILVTDNRKEQDKWLKDATLALSELHADEDELEVFPVAVGGIVLGHRADRIYIDADIDTASLNERQRAWFTNSLACRLDVEGFAAIITIKEGADVIVEPIHRSLTSMSNDFPTVDTCNHLNTEPQRNAALRMTELVCVDCEATLRIVSKLQEAETG